MEGIALSMPSSGQDRAVEAEQVIGGLRVGELDDLAINQVGGGERLPGSQVRGDLDANGLPAFTQELDLETIGSRIQQPERWGHQRQIQIVDKRGVQPGASGRIFHVTPFERGYSRGKRELISGPTDLTRPALEQNAVQTKLQPVPVCLGTYFEIK